MRGAAGRLAVQVILAVVLEVAAAGALSAGAASRRLGAAALTGGEPAGTQSPCQSAGTQTEQPAAPEHRSAGTNTDRTPYSDTANTDTLKFCT